MAYLDGVKLPDRPSVSKLSTEIIELLDKFTLLGAAYDCMPESTRDKFRKQLIEIISENLKD